MTQATLLLSSGITLVVGATYGYVALQLANRQDLRDASRSAVQLFALWWAALGVNLVLVALVDFAAAMGVLTFGWQMADSILQRGLLALSLVGLMAYLLYVLTGRTRILLLSSVYTLYFLFLMGTLVTQQPTDVSVLRWRTDLAYARPPAVWSQGVSILFILVPPVLASIAYLRLLPSVQDRSRRYRIVVVSSSILVWWVAAVIAGLPALLDNEVVQVLGRSLSVASAFAVLAAFRPPVWVKRRYGIQDYESAA